ncbi:MULTISPECIES: glycosyltransferase family 4 protein [Gluconobacter]|uniref:glycosyltransferase family 4 protein n=1 Tax=Gluconobacter TaxID=441 RepID=UPI000A3B7EBF|nr:glycosyltransferase family 4 protein [Gluconobacter sp. DsW_058]MBS1036356.1 glycosyltransferase family 4 protein [Gluconobacter cerinus]OUJ08543.1 glycosyl transferase [Gluconobacter sp. DsW_058]
MRFLFVHQNFPGQFLHFVRHLHEQGGHEIVFISEANAGEVPGVRRVIYRVPRLPSSSTHPHLREFEYGILRAEAVATAAKTLKQLGYEPDIIIGHHGWGELLNLGDVFPRCPILGYFEFFYHADRNDVGFDPEFPSSPDLAAAVRIKNSINLQALSQANGYGQTPTQFQRSTYPAWAQEKISLLREGVNLDLCKPEPQARKRNLVINGVKISPRDALITYVARNLEPYRGFHSVMRALPRILAERKDAHIIMVGGDQVSYGAPPPGRGSWREILLRELEGQLDLSRIHFVGKVAYDDFRALLKRSDAHLYLTYPFVASWSLREAMATGCPIVGSDTAPVSEFITDGLTGRLVPFLEPDRIADVVLELLEDRKQARRLGQDARRYAEAELCLQGYLKRYDALVQEIVSGHYR